MSNKFLSLDSIKRYHNKISQIIDNKQDNLISGINIKTINGESMLGGGNINVIDNQIINIIYPVGSIYLSVSETNPEILFGFGKWEQIKDRFLLSAGDTYVSGSTGGEAEHKLTIDEMPSHTHRIKTDIDSPDFNITWPEWTEYTWGWRQEENETIAPGASTTFTGGNKSHNNMPPYLTVYMWKRVE
jgi:hypothetical protein